MTTMAVHHPPLHSYTLRHTSSSANPRLRAQARPSVVVVWDGPLRKRSRINQTDRSAKRQRQDHQGRREEGRGCPVGRQRPCRGQGEALENRKSTVCKLLDMVSGWSRARESWRSINFVSCTAAWSRRPRSCRMDCGHQNQANGGVSIGTTFGRLRSDLAIPIPRRSVRDSYLTHRSSTWLRKTDEPVPLLSAVHYKQSHVAIPIRSKQTIQAQSICTFSHTHSKASLPPGAPPPQ